VGSTKVPISNQYYVSLRTVFLVTELKRENKSINILKTVTWVELRESKTRNVGKNVILRRIRAVEKQ
jgi:Tfp pilus assembly protein PilZ